VNTGVVLEVLPMKKRLCITPCGRTKIWDRCPEAGVIRAEEAYVGAFAKACQAYAKRFFTNWVILSAKHGVLLPDDPVPENYDVGFQMKGSQVITVERLREHFCEKGFGDLDEVVVLGGKKHVRVVQQVVGEQVRVVWPLAGCKGIGYMLQRLRQAVEAGREIEG
jgi:hypothetical protein